MKKRFILAILATIALLAAGCGTLTTSSSNPSSGTAGAETGLVKFLVTDAPPSNNVTSIMLTVSGVSVHMAGPDETTTTFTTTAPAITTGSTATAAATTNPATTASTTAATSTGTTTASTGTEPAVSTESSVGWITIPVSGPNPFDLLKLQGIDELLGSSQLAAGRYTQIRLEIVKAEVSLGGGALQAATIPSGELKFITPFDVIAGVTTDIKLDFDAQKSVNITGNSKVMIKPVVKLTINNENTSQFSSVTGVVSAVSVASNTISVLPSGATQPVVLFVNPQTVIILNEVQASLSDLAALPAGSTATVSYDVSSLKAVRIEVVTPATTTTATTV